MTVGRGVEGSHSFASPAHWRSKAWWVPARPHAVGAPAQMAGMAVVAAAGSGADGRARGRGGRIRWRGSGVGVGRR